MAKKSAPERGAMSSAIREFLTENPNTRNKDVVAALAEKGLTVSPNMVSIIKAKLGGTKGKRPGRPAGSTSAASSGNAAGLDAVMVLYKAARGQSVSKASINSAFMALVEHLS